jgi:hypothetical protein
MPLPTSGPLSLNDIQTEFGGTNPIGLNEYYAGGGLVPAGTSGTFGAVPSSGAISIQNFYGTSKVLVPTGLIVPLYNTTTVPSGWSDFTAANGRMIIGAGSSYGAGATGGSSTTSISGTLSTVGAHNPTNFTTGSGGGPDSSASNSAGSHNHTFSATVTSTDAYKTFKLIKAGAGNAKLPTNAMLLGTTSLSGLTNVETSTNRLLLADTSYGSTGGSSTPSAVVTSSTNGDHKHGDTADGGDGSATQRLGAVAGNHNHSLTVTLTLATQRAVFSAWTNASAAYDLVTNGIALWESATPPDGWFICDGGNGTVDLRNYFLYIGTTGTQGTRTGNNVGSWNVSQAGFSTSHSHLSQIIGSAPGGNNSHLDFAWSHTHTSSGTVTVTQPYYALYFIQKGA